jgi:hypothetical protein
MTMSPFDVSINTDILSWALAARAAHRCSHGCVEVVHKAAQETKYMHKNVSDKLRMAGFQSWQGVRVCPA